MGEFSRRNWKEQRHYRHKPGYYSTLVELDIKREKQFEELAAQPRKYSKSDWDKGVAWFNEGLSLEEADEAMRANGSFMNGFNHAKRLVEINEALENRGREWFAQGRSLEEACERYINHPAFIKGYNDAKSEAQIRSLKV